MRDKNLEFGVGVFMVLGLVALAYLTLKLGTGAMVGGDSYVVEARFTNTGGLNEGASVLMAGVTVGRVEGIRLDPSDYSAIVEMRIRSSVKLPTDTMASIRTSELIGDKCIALAPGAEEDFLQPSARITLTESAVELESLISKMAFGSVKESEDGAKNPPDKANTSEP